MNKTELVAAIAEKAGLSKKDAEKALVAGEKVQLVGFGTFEVRQRAEKQARNLKTNETIIVPASKIPAFKAGKGLKDAVK